MSYNEEELKKNFKQLLSNESLLSLMLHGNLGGKGMLSSIELVKGKDRPGAASDKKVDQKRDADKDRQIKRINIPSTLKLLASLEVPLDMVDPGVYLEVSRKALNEALQQAKAHRLSALVDSLEKAISKCDKLIQKGPEEYTKKKKEKELSDYDLMQLLKKPSFIDELEEQDLSKIKNSEIREKVGSLLSKRATPVKSIKDKWENDYFAYYKNKYLKKD